MKTIQKWITKRGFFIVPLLMVLATTLLGCGASDGTANSDSGEVLISLTDAEGDFMNYEVDVKSIKLTRKDGTQIEALPQKARIDFTEYVDLEEWVAAATIPKGVYTHAALVLDYSDPNIQVEVAGLSTPAVAQDAAGNAITTIEMKVKLDEQRQLVIAPGIPSHLRLDFDLKLSNQVDTDPTPPVVTVEPVLLAEVDLEKPKRRRARGPLLGVREDAQKFQIGLRPFHHRIDHRIDGERDFGKLEVITGAETVFEIDGVTALGAEGLTLLAAKARFTPVIVFGNMNLRERLFRAKEVIAGTSVPGGDKDALRGTVIARSGDRLTVRGASVNRGGGRVILNSNVTVLLGENTKVTKQGVHRDAANAFGKDDISVGQKITVFGTISGTLPDGLDIDASAGHVRMLFTNVSGTVVSQALEEVVLDLQSINGRRIALFDFTGTGSDPANYVVGTGMMTLDDVEIGGPIRLRGHVTAFGQAPPDFVANTIMDVSNVRALMVIGWDPPTANPFLASSDLGLTVDITGAGRHHVIRARVATALTAEPAPQVRPIADRGRYAIRQLRTTTIHHNFATFVQDLNSRLNTDATMGRLHAKGRYTDATQTIEAKTVTVALK